MRDDFPAATKQKLAARAGHKCSNPACLAPTSGPHHAQDGAVNVGVAAHISGASPNGPRYDATLTAAERRNIKNGVWLCQNCAKHVDDDKCGFHDTVLHQWKASAEREAKQQVGKTQPKRSLLKSVERALKRDHKLRDDLKLAFTRPWDEIQRKRAERGDGRERPFDTFRYSKMVIHRLGDENYPDIVNENGISSWFRLEPYDFYHNGIKFITWIESGVIEDCQGYAANMHWAIIPFGAEYDRSMFRAINIWKLCLIPYRNIRHYDLKGDEYYNEPHLYCDFSCNGAPYERVEYAVVAEDDEYYDWPLTPELQLPTEEVVIKTQATKG